jgi:hypothetical protein
MLLEPLAIRCVRRGAINGASMKAVWPPWAVPKAIRVAVLG